MPYIKGKRVGKLKIILIREKLMIKDLHKEMKKQCEGLGIKAVPRNELSRMGYGDRPDRCVSTYLRVVNALNSLRRKPEEYTLYDLIDTDEILKPKNNRV